MSDEQVRVQVVLSTCPERETLRISHALVSGGVAACVNIAHGITSVYEWEGEICEDKECLLVIKSRSDQIEALRNLLLDVHPYEVPEILVLEVDQEKSHRAYLDWVVRVCAQP
ncbi:MAG: divalent-cation tolerance protein CutA [Myxococcales bacterium]|nr:divalent-cation tolerance protein CutA [Myxococcales bacterium]